jgi:hypothetical protein
VLFSFWLSSILFVTPGDAVAFRTVKLAFSSRDTNSRNPPLISQNEMVSVITNSAAAPHPEQNVPVAEKWDALTQSSLGKSLRVPDEAVCEPLNWIIREQRSSQGLHGSFQMHE